MNRVICSCVLAQAKWRRQWLAAGTRSQAVSPDVAASVGLTETGNARRVVAFQQKATSPNTDDLEQDSLFLRQIRIRLAVLGGQPSATSFRACARSTADSAMSEARRLSKPRPMNWSRRH